MCILRAGATLGEGYDSLVSFPGATLPIEHARGSWLVGGLPVGDAPVAIQLDDGVSVTLSLVGPPAPARLEWPTDVRLLVASLAMILTAASWQAMSDVVVDNSHEVAVLVHATSAPLEQAAGWLGLADLEAAKIDQPIRPLRTPPPGVDAPPAILGCSTS
jgi:hypothetical protein